ncbi:hypothetical protein COSO111634_18130 [Corallococcus soli]
MNVGEPTVMPRARSSWDSAASRTMPAPKSRTSTRRAPFASRVTTSESSVRSPCTSPRACAASSPASACASTSPASTGDSGSGIALSDSPSGASINTQGSPWGPGRTSSTRAT